MKNELRLKRKTMSEEMITEIINTGEYGVLGLIDPEGCPYLVPMSYAVEDGMIVFHSAVKGFKMECMEHSRAAIFNINRHYNTVEKAMSVKYDSVIIRGEIEFLEGDKKRRAIHALVKKYCPTRLVDEDQVYAKEERIVAVFGMKMDSVIGKHSDPE